MLPLRVGSLHVPMTWNSYRPGSFCSGSFAASRSIQAELEHCPGAEFTACPQNGRGETVAGKRIGEKLSFQANGGAPVDEGPVFAGAGGQEVGGVELQAGQVGAQIHADPADFAAQGGRMLAGKHKVVVIAVAVF